MLLKKTCFFQLPCNRISGLTRISGRHLPGLGIFQKEETGAVRQLRTQGFEAYACRPSAARVLSVRFMRAVRLPHACCPFVSRVPLPLSPLTFTDPSEKSFTPSRAS